MIAYLPGEDLSVVILASKGFLWPTELMPALIGAAPPIRTASAGAPLSGRFEDGLFRYDIAARGRVDAGDHRPHRPDDVRARRTE